MRWMSAGALLGLCACTSLAPAAQGQAAALIRVDRAWIHAAPQGQFDTWAFATITTARKADALVEVRSPDAESVVLRATNVTDAGRKVRTVLAIPVTATGETVLSPDTYFISFITARHAFVAGQSITATLRFASGTVVPVTFRVTEGQGDPQDAGN